MSADSPATDGLDELQASRLSRQLRRPPAPKRPRALQPTPAIAGEGTTNDPSPGEDAAPARPSGPDIVDVRDTNPVQGDDGPSAHTDGGPLTLVQVRITEAQLDYLDEIDAVAAARRFDVTDAAVVRFALSQLMAAHSPDQIVERLGRPKVRGRRGRPRH